MKKHKENKGSKCKIVQEIINIPPSNTDPNGSYTGAPVCKGEKPVQDADDL